jgi:MarR family transcriptional regulator, 2-MHQ and catechol-resistance regulon repressor
MKAFQAVAGYASRGFRESGLADTDFRVLEVLLHKSPLRVNAIGPKVFLTPGSISTAVDRLYEKGLVTRTESGTDRRVRMVDLTPAGRSLIRQIFSSHAKEMEKLAEILTVTERVQLVKALKKLGKRAVKYDANRVSESTEVPLEKRKLPKRRGRHASRTDAPRRR